MRFLRALWVSLLAVSLCPLVLQAQTIVLTSPNHSQTVQEGDDFAAAQLGDAWECNEQRDIGYEENFAGRSIHTTDGIWHGINEQAGGYVFPLFGGFSGALHAEGLPGDKQLPRFGINHPIDASRYRLLSFRMNHSARSTYALYWKNESSTDLWPDGSQMRANFDGFYLSEGHFNTGHTIYSFDLSAAAFEISQGQWEGKVVALRIDPSIGGPSGAATEIDWIRLSDPDSAPTIPIRWTSSNITNNSLITVWVDTDSGGYDGSPLARYRYDKKATPVMSGSFSSTSASLAVSRGFHALPTAALPPGEYYFYVTAHLSSDSDLVELARSNYSGRLIINQAPGVYFTSPTEISGVDYAAKEVRNPWDMSDRGDVLNLPESDVPYPLRQYSEARFDDGIFQAMADAPLAELGNTESDAQVRLNVQPTRPIDTSRYRYLTYRIGAADDSYPSISEKVRSGWVTRPVFWNTELLSDGGSGKAHILYEGHRTYTIDLWEDSLVERGLPWKAYPSVSFLRIDPLETTLPTRFFIDWVKLTSENYPGNGRFTLSWTIEDRDNGVFSVSLFYDTDQEGFDGIPLESLEGLGAGSHQYVWNLAGMPAGRYYPYLEVRDNVNRRRVYAPVPVVVDDSSSTSALMRVPYDYDGDGTSDHIVYRRPASGTFFLKGSSSLPTSKIWGGLTSQALHGDFDGDRKSDYAVVFENGGVLEWFIVCSHDGSLLHRTWGVRGDYAVAADYDGDFRDEIAIFREGMWYVLYGNGAVAVVAWGQAGDLPVPGDYDGDGAADLAVWRPEDGMWWVRYSNLNPEDSLGLFATVQWGLSEDRVVPGDYDADGRTDFAVWRPSNGTWYLRSSRDDAVEVWQWGLPGDLPLTGDFSGDGLLDLTVWRPGTGHWYHNDRRGITSVVQWGLPVDHLPDSGRPIY